MKTRITLLGLLLWLGIGLTIKHLRYSEPFVLGVIDAEYRLSRYLQQQGWEFSERVVLGKDERFGTLVFKRPYCANVIAVTLIDTGDSTAEIFERAVKGDVAYVDDGAHYSSPPTARLLLRTMTSSILNAFGLHIRPALPIVAVAPASAADDGFCGTNLVRSWQPLIGEPNLPSDG